MLAGESLRAFIIRRRSRDHSRRRNRAKNRMLGPQRKEGVPLRNTDYLVRFGMKGDRAHCRENFANLQQAVHGTGTVFCRRGSESESHFNHCDSLTVVSTLWTNFFGYNGEEGFWSHDSGTLTRWTFLPLPGSNSSSASPYKQRKVSCELNEPRCCDRPLLANDSDSASSKDGGESIESSDSCSSPCRRSQAMSPRTTLCSSFEKSQRHEDGEKWECTEQVCLFHAKRWKRRFCCLPPSAEELLNYSDELQADYTSSDDRPISDAPTPAGPSST